MISFGRQLSVCACFTCSACTLSRLSLRFSSLYAPKPLQDPLGSHFGAIPEQFWSHAGIILEPMLGQSWSYLWDPFRNNSL